MMDKRLYVVDNFTTVSFITLFINRYNNKDPATAVPNIINNNKFIDLRMFYLLLGLFLAEFDQYVVIYTLQTFQ
jgi:hypothetical protein